MRRRAALLIFVLLIVAPPVLAQVTFEPGKDWEGPEPKPEGPLLKTDRSEYEHALAVYQSGDTRKAIALSDHIVKTYKSGPWVERAALLKARAYFKRGDLKQADKELVLIRRRYPGTAIAREMSDLQMAIATAYTKKGKYVGVKILEETVENNPYGSRADEAQFKVGQYHLRKRNYVDAAEAFALVVAQYRDSPYREDAMFLRAKATYLDNEGPRRDPLPYEEARVGLNDYLQSYPQGKYADQARALLVKIETALALKAYLIAEYYRKQRQRRAAERYYRHVVKKYPNSKWASKALRRLPKAERAVLTEPAPETSPEPGKQGQPPATEPVEKKGETE